MKHTNEEELFAYREGEMKGRETIAAHLRECGQCRAELERMEEVFQALNALPVPDPGEEYGTRVWRQIANRLPERRVDWWAGFFMPRRLLALGAAAALLILVFYLGRKTGAKAGGEEIVDASRVRERVLLVAVGEHLGKSEMILMELSNAQPAEAGKSLINISTAQKRAEDLVEENRLYRQTALNGGDNAMASTLDELQRVLMDVANSPAEVTPAQFESIQKRIAAQGILLKVRVVRQELRTQETGSKPAPAQNDSTAKARNKA
ncbi:MAG TPA: hypothetical protein VK514_07145 [Candidatus Acidoferrum sp.]|jgi:hypothetical protein|nr:hypothetical protein [Candidatus Acidoferrum sp.]